MATLSERQKEVRLACYEKLNAPRQALIDARNAYAKAKLDASNEIRRERLRIKAEYIDEVFEAYNKFDTIATSAASMNICEQLFSHYLEQHPSQD
jgi:vacuolar-type H+-ATPase subunit E/Vma4